MMKRPSSCDSLGALMSICPSSTDEHNQENINPIYTREFQTMLEGLDEEGCVEESGHVSEKKRRLNLEQVKALEKNFEVENKLEPERKVKLAQELGLQPRQVAVWFQNRRARWKTKQLERDYGVLKAKYDGLQCNFEALKSDNEALIKEIRELKSKLNVDFDHTSENNNNNNKVCIKEEQEPLASDSEEKTNLDDTQTVKSLSLGECSNLATTDLNMEENNLGDGGSVFVDFKDGSSDDSDSSAILNEEITTSSTGKGILVHNNSNQHHQFLDIHDGSSNNNTSMNISFQFTEPKIGYGDAAAAAAAAAAHKQVLYQPQFVKIEEHNFFGEESCSTLFSDDQPPTLHWYCSDDWN